MLLFTSFDLINHCITANVHSMPKGVIQYVLTVDCRSGQTLMKDNIHRLYRFCTAWSYRPRWMPSRAL